VLRQYVSPWLFNARSLPFDVVHLHGDDWFWLRRRVPTVRTFHGSALNEARSARTLRRRIDQSAIFALELVARSRADFTLAVGPDAHAIYATDEILATGIDVASEPAADRDPAILFVGTWDGRKRGRLLHEVFTSQVRPRHPGAQLWMVSDACLPADGVTWYPSPTDADLHELMRRASAFCLPSLYEGFGIPYLEAMAAGAAVVASPNSGARMLLQDGRAGILAEDHELGDGLVALLTDAERRQELAAAGRRRAEDFAWPRVLDRYEAAYEEAIERFAARQRTASSAAARR
jgi:phosphatidylinositol alpha-mannosyltransferase